MSHCHRRNPVLVNSADAADDEDEGQCESSPPPVPILARLTPLSAIQHQNLSLVRCSGQESRNVRPVGWCRMSSTSTAIAVNQSDQPLRRGIHPWCAVGLCLTIMAGLVWSRSVSTQRSDQLVADCPYDVPFEHRQATADIYLTAGVPIQLIVSNLNSNSSAARLQGVASPLSTPPQFPPRRLAAWRSDERRPQRSPALRRAPTSNSGARIHLASPAKRDFWLHVTDTALENPEAYQRLRSQLVAVRPTVEVYADSSLIQDSEISASLRKQASDVADQLQHDILPKILNLVGPLADPDRNGRLTVLMTPWLSRLRGGTVQVRGFVRSSDLRRDIAPPFSNRADLLYLNSELPTGTALRTLLLHEVTHAALSSQSLINHSTVPRASRPEWDDWLNEGVAHLVERAGGGDWSNLDYRLARYWQRPESAPLVVRDYYRSQRWRDHGCRGATFLFLQWCQQEAAKQGVTEFIPALLATRASGTRAVEQVCETSFAELYRQWTISQLKCADPASLGRTLTSGPRRHRWHLNEIRTNSFQVLGTATQYVELHTNQTGWYRLQIVDDLASDADERWQLTLVGSPKSRRPVDLRARWTPSAGTAAPILQLDCPDPLPAGWKLEQVAFESIREPQPRIRHWSADDLLPLDRGTFQIPISPDDVAGAGSILKVKLRHTDGSVNWEWVDVPAKAPELPAAVAELESAEPSAVSRAAARR